MHCGPRRAQGKALLDGMVRKRWLVREAQAEERDARRVERVAVLVEDARLPKLNANQMSVLAELAARAAAGSHCGRLRERLERGWRSRVNAGTLVRRGLVRLEEEESAFRLGGVGTTGKKNAHEHALNEAQTEALATIAAAMEKGGFQPHLLYGVTGSGKTAVYVAAMQRTLARAIGDAAGAGDRADAGDGGADVRGVWRRGRPAALGA